MAWSFHRKCGELLISPLPAETDIGSTLASIWSGFTLVQVLLGNTLAHLSNYKSQSSLTVEHIYAATLPAPSLSIYGLTYVHNESWHLSPTSLRMIDTWKSLPMSRCKFSTNCFCHNMYRLKFPYFSAF